MSDAFNAQKTTTCEYTASGQTEDEDRRVQEIPLRTRFRTGGSVLSTTVTAEKPAEYKTKGVWGSRFAKPRQADEESAVTIQALNGSWNH